MTPEELAELRERVEDTRMIALVAFWSLPFALVAGVIMAAGAGW